MAISKNILLHKLSGHIGKQFVVKQYGEKTVLAGFPDLSNREFTPKQKRNQALMTEANEEAQRIMADEEMRDRAQVRLNVTRNKLYTALIKEYFQTMQAAEEQLK